MQTSKRERLFLYGIIPVAAALIGAVAQALLAKWLGPDRTVDALTKALSEPGLSVDDRVKLVEAIKSINEPYWSVVRNLAVGAVVGASRLLGTSANG